MTDLKSIFPVRKLTVEEFKVVARKIAKPSDSIIFKAMDLMERYESLTSRVLCREILIGEKAWFKGFRINTPEGVKNAICIVYDDDENHVSFIANDKRSTLHINGFFNGQNVTVADLIYHIDYYNRTASTPIKLEWTENFELELLGND